VAAAVPPCDRGNVELGATNRTRDGSTASPAALGIVAAAESGVAAGLWAEVTRVDASPLPAAISSAAVDGVVVGAIAPTVAAVPSSGWVTVERGVTNRMRDGSTTSSVALEAPVGVTPDVAPPLWAEAASVDGSALPTATASAAGDRVCSSAVRSFADAVEANAVAP
jgi:hypothetical protein